MALERDQLLAACCIPDAGSAVAAAGEDLRLIRAPRRLIDRLCVALERDQFGAAGSVPDAGGAVVAAGEDLRLILAPRRLPDRPCVALERDELLAAGSVPDAGGAVVAAGEDLRLIRLHVACQTDPVWPWSVTSSSPLAASQMRAVPSSLRVRTFDSSSLHVA